MRLNEGNNSQQLAWLIRRHCIEMAHRSHASHIGSDLSATDILAVLYAGVLRVDPQNPEWELRDRFILSKGHSSAALYAALAERGFFPREELMTFDADGSPLLGHVSHLVPGVDYSTGSLGHGFSAGIGMAYAAKKRAESGYEVFVLLGDGECNEGSVWEGALFANHFRLDNLTAVIDRNQMQSLDFCDNVLELENLGDKWRAFGWNVIEVNGHDHKMLKEAFEQAEELRKQESGRPTIVICETVIGHGISFMQNDILWHYRYPHTGWEYDLAVTELHRIMPEGVTDPYTPDGIHHPMKPSATDDIGNDHTLTATWKPAFPEHVRRVEASPATDERVLRVNK